ncbi:FAD-binding protein [Fusibacter sp. A1]|nr:FAD-dependent oxidoreductase [Fusibacter sp. A1]RXV60650.1 FAD-binding protein [Fusibacter sp. A1]
MVIGGGPAGIAAALEIDKAGGSVVLLEREGRLGGILKQCIHDGFGLEKFERQLSGPEYAQVYLDRLDKSRIDVHLKTFVTGLEKTDSGFKAVIVDRQHGMSEIRSKTVVLATGCRERTGKQIFINGERPSGVYTAGTAQYLVNIDGVLPCERCVILGSGDIGLIMARRLTLEGAQVVGVFEAKAEPSGLKRNIQQCLNDFDIPLNLSKTVTRLAGNKRLTGVYVADLDEQGKVDSETEQFIACDGLILSVGLIPENEIAEKLGIQLDATTKGPIVDKQMMTSVEGVFCCGNALHVFDLVDHVSDSGEIAGSAALSYILLSKDESQGGRT